MRCAAAIRLVVALQDAEVELADRLVDQAALILVVERLAGDLLGRDEAQLGDLGADRLERAPRLGFDLALRLLESPLSVGLGLLLDPLLHRLTDLAGLAEDLLRLRPGLADQLAVLFEQLAGFVARLVGFLERAADALATLVDHLLDRAEGIPLEDEEDDQEADDRPDHQPRRDLDQGVAGEQSVHLR